MKIKELEERLFGLYPKQLAADYDNVGLLVGNGEEEINKIVVALDCTPAVIEYAKSVGANLIVTHHPVIFAGEKSVVAGDRVFELIRSGISCIGMHTNFDTATGGVMDVLCEKTGVQNTILLQTDQDVSIRIGEIASPLSADEFAASLKSALGGFVRYCDGGKPIKRVAVCCGSGSDFIKNAVNAGADAYVSGELDHYDFLDSMPFGVSVFDCGHFETERIAIQRLKASIDEICGFESLQYDNSEIKIV